jgi:hypothetical protein
MTFGKEGESGARVHDLADVGAILDVFQKHGYDEIDSARGYCGGTSEDYLGQIGWKERGLVMDTKLYPMGVSFDGTWSACKLMIMPVSGHHTLAGGGRLFSLFHVNHVDTRRRTCASTLMYH